MLIYIHVIFEVGMSLSVAVRIGLAFAGSFLGAGFVSGKELSQFFSVFGTKGYIGLLIAIILLAASGILIMCLAHDTKITEFDYLIVRNNNHFFITLVGLFEIFFLVGVAVIMSAGAGALINQLFGFSSVVSSFIFCIIVCILSLGGIKIMMNVFSLTVPVMIISVIAVFVICSFRNGFTYTFTAGLRTTNPLASNYLLSAVIFVSYNIFSAIGVLTPVALTVKNKRIIIIGVILGAIFLLIIASCIYFTMVNFPSSNDTELPMLFVCSDISRFFGIVYGFLLLLGMIGTSTSTTVAVLDYFINRFGRLFSRTLICAIIGIILFVMSLAGFGNLISVVYPIAGYLGMAALLCILEHKLYLIKGQKHNEFKNNYD